MQGIDRPHFEAVQIPWLGLLELNPDAVLNGKTQQDRSGDSAENLGRHRRSAQRAAPPPENARRRALFDPAVGGENDCFIGAGGGS
jgi:hypothetical protein